MRAVQAVELGDPEVLQPASLPVPEIGPGEVLVRNTYASVNFADIKARRGGHHLKREVPFVPGLDVSGVIHAVGPGVEGFAPGQRVAAATDGGSYAEFAKARAALTYPVPDGDIDMRQAAGIVAMMTAYNVLIVIAGLQEGETVLVHAAAGGVGTLLLQLARLYGAGRVIGVVGSEAKIAVALEHGADEVIVTRGSDYPVLLDDAAPGGVDVVMDSVGGAYFAAAFPRLATYGRIVNFGNAAGDPPSVEVSAMHKENLAIFGYSSGTYRKSRPEGVQRAARRMLEHLATGELTVEIGGVYSLEEAADAHRAIESRTTTGKLLLEI